MRTIFILLTAITLSFFTISLYGQHENHNDTLKTENVTNVTNQHSSNIQNSNAENVEEESTQKHGEGGHGGGMEPLLFIIIALALGSATRHFLRKSPIPYTVLLLILGLIFGVCSRLGYFSHYLSALDGALSWAGHIDPHVILFVFLPTLIFEAAFAMDFHTFKKTSVNSFILAVPGIIIAMFLTGVVMMGIQYMGIGLTAWDWSIAMMFGALISATDPVAVVALLKDLGVSSKLSTLIDGESILNDGTAIVLFMVFFVGLTGSALSNSPVVEFGRVAIGGILIGLVIAAVTIAWVKRVFNDAMVEISVIVIAAYITFFIAEKFLHVSGVLGLFALGLSMASIGKTRISPEVEHFLHEFWELAAFIANTLIFIIVGVVIANQTVFTAGDFIVLGITYLSIHIIRGIMIAMFFPLMKRAGYGLGKKDSVVLWYGALRGAVGLALALVVAGVDDKYLSPEIKNQFVFLTAGIVTMTLLINATTIKWIISALGMNKIAPAKAMMIISANQYLKQSAENALDRIKTDRFLSSADWNVVNTYLPEEAHIKFDKDAQIDTMAEMRKRILEKEKSSYWYLFKEGMISPSAVRKLSGGIDEMLDESGLNSLAHRKDLEEMMKTPKMMKFFQSIPVVSNLTQRYFFDRMADSYDCARGFVEAQEEALKLVESMQRSLKPDDKEGSENLSVIESEINENKIEGLTFLRNLRKNYPEIYNAIATRQAIRTLLNYELKTIERLYKNGRIDSSESQKLTEEVEERMKKLMYTPPSVKLPDTVELIYEIDWLKNLDPKTLSKITKVFQKKNYAVGDTIIRENSHDDGFFIISRGTVKITIGEEIIDVLGQGAFFGEMSILTGNPRNASVKAESPLTVLWVASNHLRELIKESADIENYLWSMAGQRFTENTLRKHEPYNIWKLKDFHKWLSKGKVVTVDTAEIKKFDDKVCVLVSGTGMLNGQVINAPALINPSEFESSSTVKIFVSDKI